MPCFTHLVFLPQKIILKIEASISHLCQMQHVNWGKIILSLFTNMKIDKGRHLGKVLRLFNSRTRSFFKIIFLYSFICGCAWSFSLHGLLPSCGECWLLIAVASLVAERRLTGTRGFSSCSKWAQLQLPGLEWQRPGLVALWLVGSSQTRDQIHIPCIGRQALKHRATREVPETELSRLSYCRQILIINCFHVQGMTV